MIDGKIPKYYFIKQSIAKKIESEEFDTNHPIPSEKELMEMYGVSRITIRKAIDELVLEGYLYKIQGKGTYVKTEEGGSNLFSIVSNTEDILRLGLEPTKKTIISERMQVSVKRAKLLEIDPTESIYMLGRIMFANKEPVNYTISYIPEKLFPNLLNHNFDQESLYQILQSEYGVRITKARRTVEAILAKDEIAEYLEIAENSPIILFRCVTYGILQGREIPIENFKCYYRTDRYKFYIDQVR